MEKFDFNQFNEAIQAVGDSMPIGKPQPVINNVQAQRAVFNEMADGKMKRLGLRIIDETVALAYMFRAGVDYSKVSEKAHLIGGLRDSFRMEVMRREL